MSTASRVSTHEHFGNWLLQWEAYAAALIMARHGAEFAGSDTSPESIQAGAATMLINAADKKIAAYPGLAQQVRTHFEQKANAAAVGRLTGRVPV